MAELQVALLRGINVGGKHPVPMATLAGLFTELGCTAVRTYVQSGNVLFAPPSQGLSAERAAHAIEARFGFAVPIILRSRTEMARMLAANPFATTAADPRLLHAVFLAAPLSPAQLATLRAQIAGNEQLAAHGTELYLSLPHGAGRSRLAMACVAPKLPATNTMRNWLTILKLAAMLAE